MASSHRKELPWSALASNNDSSTMRNKAGSGFNTKKLTFASIVQGRPAKEKVVVPKPYIKAEQLCIPIPEDIYQEGLKKCHNHLHGRLLMPKGSSPVKVLDLKTRLSLLWNLPSGWNIVSLGRGFYEFSFDSLDDLYHVRSTASWNLQPGLFKVFAWKSDFNLLNVRITTSLVWIRLYGLPQEYWDSRVLFKIASGLGTPIPLDYVTSTTFELRHYARILVDLNLKAELWYRILIEMDSFEFFIDVEYENLPYFCSYYHTIGHLSEDCVNVTQESAPGHKNVQAIVSGSDAIVSKKTGNVTQVYVARKGSAVTGTSAGNEKDQGLASVQVNPHNVNNSMESLIRQVTKDSNVVSTIMESGDQPLLDNTVPGIFCMVNKGTEVVNVINDLVSLDSAVKIGKSVGQLESVTNMVGANLESVATDFSTKNVLIASQANVKQVAGVKSSTGQLKIADTVGVPHTAVPANVTHVSRVNSFTNQLKNAEMVGVVPMVKSFASSSLGPINYDLPTGHYSIEEDMRLTELEMLQESMSVEQVVNSGNSGTKSVGTVISVIPVDPILELNVNSNLSLGKAHVSTDLGLNVKCDKGRALCSSDVTGSEINFSIGRALGSDHANVYSGQDIQGRVPAIVDQGQDPGCNLFTEDVALESPGRASSFLSRFKSVPDLQAISRRLQALQVHNLYREIPKVNVVSDLSLFPAVVQREVAAIEANFAKAVGKNYILILLRRMHLTPMHHLLLLGQKLVKEVNTLL